MTESSYGRVVRLHFACKAELPIGSSLRVTSSHLFDPGSLTPADPNDAKSASATAAHSSLPDNANMDISQMSLSVQQSYASSVEMVTSPDEWPVWRTRKPVVITLRHHHGKVEQHRYRYLVVTPGAQENELIDGSAEFMQDVELQGASGMGAVTTQDDNYIGTNVMLWEDPFVMHSQGLTSAISLPSVQRQNAAKTLGNLPYRTVEIDTITAKVKYQEPDDLMNSDNNGTNLAPEFTSDGVQIDTWNRSEDYSFISYCLREEINRQNRAKKQMIISRYSSFATSGSGRSDESVVGDLIHNGTTPRLSTRVSFSQMLDEIEADEETVDSNITSLTATPYLGSTLSMSSKVSTARQRQRIFFVCYHLPVNLSYNPNSNEWSATWAESLLAATEGSQVVKTYESHWVGTVSCPNHPILSEEDKDAVRTVLAKMDCTPLFLDEETVNAHYHGFCKQVLWPAFHNVDLLDLCVSGMLLTGEKTNCALDSKTDWDQSCLEGWWEAYKKVNYAFSDMLASYLKPGDIMWVHDYHLSLLPKIVDQRERLDFDGRSVTKKVFLLHIPFPVSHVFRELEFGEEILKGMVHADVVGFHSFDHARHFLNATKRILGLHHESMVGGLIGIKVGKKTVLVSMHNVSIEPVQLDAVLNMPSVNEYVVKCRNAHPSRIAIGGLDVAQRLSGVTFKLLAFERLLSDYPIYKQKLVMIQKCLIPGSRKADETVTLAEIRALVKRIVDKFGPNVISYEELHGSSLPTDRRLAMWKGIDVLINTPIREGLNLWPLEYVYTREKTTPAGVVISSEFSVVSSVLNGALRVNPFDIQMTVAAIDKALTMKDEEKEGRSNRDTKFITSCTSSQWTKNVLRDLSDATAVTSTGDEEDSVDTNILLAKVDKNGLITSTHAFLEYERNAAFAKLDIDAVVKAYNATSTRVIVLDLNGTIILKEETGKYMKREILGSSGFDVSPEVTKALTLLCDDPNNTVFVVSGDSKENVIKAVGNIPGLGIAASNGACFAHPLKKGESERKWEYFDLGVDWDAVKAIVLPILSKYTARSNGSFVKLTHSSIGWSYYSCDPEWGSLQASHLVLELEESLRAFNVRFVMIKGIVEVVPRRLNKGLIVKNILREVEARRQESGVDFILCMGDDIQDEKMFTAVFSFLSEHDDPTHADPQPSIVDEQGKVLHTSFPVQHIDAKNEKIYAYTCVVGKKPSHAFTHVDNAIDVSNLLLRLRDRKSVV